MQEWLIFATDKAVLLINAMALAVIVFGTVEGFIQILRSIFGMDADEHKRIGMRFGRWLVVGLTFQLAADIIETSVAPEWEDIGRLAAIAAIRTFLNYFLERDLSELQERGRAQP